MVRCQLMSTKTFGTVDASPLLREVRPPLCLDAYIAPQNDATFAELENALDDLRAGRMIVIADDEDRENEGDVMMAAEKITPEAVNFMATHARGLICLAMTGQRLDELELGLMVPDNTSAFGTAFTVSIDAIGRGVTTGISSYDRAQTILTTIDPLTHPEDLARPGHVFPLRSRAGGVLERRGQTEASVDLAQLAGLHPSGVICEVMNSDGSMARGRDLADFCSKHKLKMITVDEVVRYRLEHNHRVAHSFGGKYDPTVVRTSC